MYILNDPGPVWHERRLMNKLYMEQSVKYDWTKRRQEDWKRSQKGKLSVTKKALEEYGDIKIGEYVIWTLKYADDLVLLTTEETVLQGMTRTHAEIERYY